MCLFKELDREERLFEEIEDALDREDQNEDICCNPDCQEMGGHDCCVCGNHYDLYD